MGDGARPWGGIRIRHLTGSPTEFKDIPELYEAGMEYIKSKVKTGD